MTNKDYLTISEYAKIKGCSTSAVYKRLSTTLQPFTTMVDGKKALKIEVLQYDDKKKYSTVDNQPSSTPLQPEKKENEEVISSLLRQLEEKDKQLGEKDKQISELHKLLDQQQQLQLQTQKQLDDKTEQIALLEQPKKRWWSKK